MLEAIGTSILVLTFTIPTMYNVFYGHYGIYYNCAVTAFRTVTRT